MTAADLIPARPTTPDELGRHPAATFGKRAQLAGWRVEYRTARGPVTTRKRPDEPDERGKYALVSVTTIADTVGVRAAHPDGRRIAAWWIGRTFGEGWAASPRRNARALGIRALTAYLTEIETEEENVNENDAKNTGKYAVGALAEKSRASFEEWWTARRPSEGDDTAELVTESYVAGYVCGHAAANEQAGDAYGEGYAAGLAAVAGHAQVWVKTRKRLDALRPGDVLLGQGDRWWIVGGSDRLGSGQWEVIAHHGNQPKTVRADGQRKVDVVEQIALADALAALKDEDMGAVPLQAPVESEATR